jgi:hypothetical protein
MEIAQHRPKILILHVITAAILVWILPDFLLIPLIAYLTQGSEYACWLIERVKEKLTPVVHKRRDSFVSWVQNHKGTLKRMVRANSQAENSSGDEGSTRRPPTMVVGGQTVITHS